MRPTLSDMTDLDATNRDGETDPVDEEMATLEKPGALLKAAREKEGLSVKEVSKSLYLTRTKLEALENDDYDKLKSHVFIKGYLRKYAPLVGLDGEALVERYHKLAAKMEALVEELDEKDEDVPNTLIPKFVVPAAVFGISALVLATIFVFSGDERDDIDLGVIPASDVDEALVQQVAAMNERNRNPNERNENERTQNAEPNLDRELAAEARERSSVESLAAGANQVSVAPTEGEAGAAAGVVAEASGEVSELKFEFSEDCWLEVRDRIDTVLYTDIAKAGESLELQGQAPFSISLGNAQAVTLFWEDEMINTQPRPGNRTAKITVGEETPSR